MPELGRPSKRIRFSDINDEGSVGDIENARTNSKDQLKSRLEDVFKKYSKDFSGIADVVNFATNEVEEDNGHLRRMRHEYDAGHRVRRTVERLHSPPQGRPHNRRHSNGTADSPARSHTSLVPTTEVTSAWRQAQSQAGQTIEPHDASQQDRTDGQPSANSAPPVAESVAQASVLSNNAIQQLGQNIAEQLAKLLTSAATSIVGQQQPAVEPKTESMWDAPPLPSPPPTSGQSTRHTRIASRSAATPPAGPSSPAQSYSPAASRVRSRSLWAATQVSHTRRHEAQDEDPILYDDDADDAPRASNDTPATIGYRWTQQDDQVLIDLIKQPGWDPNRVREDAARKLPHKSERAIYLRELRLRHKHRPELVQYNSRSTTSGNYSPGRQSMMARAQLSTPVPSKQYVKQEDNSESRLTASAPKASRALSNARLSQRPATDSRIKPVKADISLIYTPSKPVPEQPSPRPWLGRWSNAKPEGSKYGTPWSAEDIKRVAKAKVDQPDADIKEIARMFPERDLHAVRTVYTKWKSGYYDTFLRSKSILGSTSEPQGVSEEASMDLTMPNDGGQAASSPLASIRLPADNTADPDPAISDYFYPRAARKRKRPDLSQSADADAGASGTSVPVDGDVYQQPLPVQRPRGRPQKNKRAAVEPEVMLDTGELNELADEALVVPMRRASSQSLPDTGSTFKKPLPPRAQHASQAESRSEDRPLSRTTQSIVFSDTEEESSDDELAGDNNDSSRLLARFQTKLDRSLLLS